MIKLYSLSKIFDHTTKAIQDITLTIGKGEFVYITGPSGAGKTTLLNTIFGTEEPTSGHILIGGRNYWRAHNKEVPLLRRKIGFVFQEFKLLNDKSVIENVALPLKVIGVGPIEIRNRCMKALSYVKLEHRANFKPLMLSGGEQQRVAIARAIVKDPAILLADEPTGNLDHDLSVEIMNLFQEVNNRGTTVIIATHDKTILDTTDKRIITMKDGRVVGGGDADGNEDGSGGQSSGETKLPETGRW